MITRIFTNRITSLDCAILLPGQLPYGKSLSVDVIFDGEKDENGILIDFSLAKKLSKNLIDAKYDHKILTSQKLCTFQNETQVMLKSSRQNKVAFSLLTYPNAVEFISENTLTMIGEGIWENLQHEIAAEILKTCPKNIKKVTIKLNEIEEKKSQNYYNYLHSLCHHKGNCQRFHGHSNVVNIFKNGSFSSQLSSQIAEKINGKYLVSGNHLIKNWEDPACQDFIRLDPEVKQDWSDLACICYKGTQGNTTVALPKNQAIIFQGESTIENIVEYICSQVLSNNQDSNINNNNSGNGNDSNDNKTNDRIEVHAYEGMNKGAIYL